MKVFVTGASGFIGTAVIAELLNAGHTVTGLARSEKSAQAVKQAGAEVMMGGLEDLESLKKGAREADGVIHTAFIHDFANFEASVAVDKAAIGAIGIILAGTNKPFIITGGLAGIKPASGIITEDDKAPAVPRASEAEGLVLAENDVKASVIRLPPSVHDKGDTAFIPALINTAREKGVSAYIGDGSNKWSSVNRLDAAALYRLILEKGEAGKNYNAVGDEGITTREIAEVIGKHLNVPVKSVSQDEATAHFGWIARFFAANMPAIAKQTSTALGWQPTHSGLLSDMAENYF